MSPSCRYGLVLGTILFVHCGLLTWSAWQHSPTHAEVQQLPAGVSILRFGRFNLAQVNPPLVRLLAAVPVAALSPKTDWQHYDLLHIDRAEYDVGVDFVHANGRRSSLLFFVARCVCIPFSLFGAYICYLWARDLYGGASGIIAAALWSFAPSVLGHGQLISTDIASASLGVSFGYSAWRWLREPSWQKAIVTGSLLGLAELTKFTCIVFFPLLVLWWLVVRSPKGKGTHNSQSCWQSVLQLAIVFLLAIYIVNWGYAFNGTPTRLSEHLFFSRTLSRLAGTQPGLHVENNDGGWIGRVPIPLPEDYLKGIDAQKVDFDTDSLCFLRGEWKRGGWWYYYLYALAVKTPLGTIGIFLFACIASLSCTKSREIRLASWHDEIVLTSTVLAILVLVSAHTALNHHGRYIFPMLPFLFIWCSKAGLAFVHGGKKRSIAILALLVSSIGSSLWCYPHEISYFNELAGGPSNGHRHLSGSNTDWGQDLFFLKRWLDRHPEARPLGLSFGGLYNPSTFDLDYVFPPELAEATAASVDRHETGGPQPGWNAISVNYLNNPRRKQEYFLRLTPVAMAGYSICIYDVTLKEANRVRRELGLSELPADWEEKRRRNEEYKNCIVDSLARSASRAAVPLIRVAILHVEYSEEQSDNGERSLRQIVESGAQCVCEPISCAEVKGGRLSGFDVLLVPGGSSKIMANTLGCDGKDAVRDFVRRGGGYVGICAGAFLATDGYPCSLDLVGAKPLADDIYTPKWGKVSMAERGTGFVTIELSDAGKRVLGDLPGLLDIRYTGGPIFSMDVRKGFPKYVPLATYRSELTRYEPQRGTMIQTPAIIAASFGDGRIILFSPHPEASETLESLILRAVLATARPHVAGDGFNE